MARCGARAYIPAMAKEIQRVLFKPGAPQELEVFRIESLRQKHYTHLIRPHRTNFYHFFILTGGSPVHVVDFLSVPLGENCLFFFNKDCVQRFDPSSEYYGYLLVFTDEFFGISRKSQNFLNTTQLFRSATFHSVVPLADEIEEFSDGALSIERELQAEFYPMQHQYLQNTLFNLLIRAERLLERSKPPGEAAHGNLQLALRFKSLLEERLGSQLPVKSFAECLGVTARQLGAATQAAFGRTPKEIANDRALLEAKRLLAHSELSVKEIGFRLGFEDIAYFSRFFSRGAGLPPVRFREKQNAPPVA